MNEGYNYEGLLDDFLPPTDEVVPPPLDVQPADIPAAPVAPPEPLPPPPPGVQGFGGAPPPDAFGSALSSLGYGLGPGNERTGQGVFGPDLPQEQRFGDPNKWVNVPDSQDPGQMAAIPWAVAGAQPMAPMMQGVAGGNWGQSLDSFGPVNRRDINLGAMASPVLDRMGQIAAGQKDQRWSPEFQKSYEQGWIEDARNNNLLAVNPELQADGGVGRVYTYESGRKAFEPYQAAPPAPRDGGGPPRSRPTNAPSGFSQNNREALTGFPSEIGGGTGGQWGLGPEDRVLRGNPNEPNSTFTVTRGNGYEADYRRNTDGSLTQVGQSRWIGGASQPPVSAPQTKPPREVAGGAKGSTIMLSGGAYIDVPPGAKAVDRGDTIVVTNERGDQIVYDRTGKRVG